MHKLPSWMLCVSERWACCLSVPLAGVSSSHPASGTGVQQLPRVGIREVYLEHLSCRGAHGGRTGHPESGGVTSPFHRCPFPETCVPSGAEDKPHLGSPWGLAARCTGEGLWPMQQGVWVRVLLSAQLVTVCGSQGWDYSSEALPAWVLRSWAPSPKVTFHSPWTGPLGTCGPAHPGTACGRPGGTVELLWGGGLGTEPRRRVWTEGPGAEARDPGGAGLRGPLPTACLTMATSFFSSSSSFSFCFFLPPPFSAVVAAGEYSRPACRGKGEPRDSGRPETRASMPPGSGSAGAGPGVVGSEVAAARPGGGKGVGGGRTPVLQFPH